jgi:hypothetical protein
MRWRCCDEPVRSYVDGALIDLGRKCGVPHFQTLQ